MICRRPLSVLLNLCQTSLLGCRHHNKAMAALTTTFLLLVLGTLYVAGECPPYSQQQHLDDRSCHFHSSFHELDQFIAYASHSFHETVYMSVIIMYMHIHRCTSFDTAAAMLFHAGSGNLRRRQIHEDRFHFYEGILRPKMDAVLHDGGNVCVESLIHRHYDDAARFWASLEQTTHSTTTLAPVHTTTTAAVTHPPVRCWVCKDLECLLDPTSHTGEVCQTDEKFCMVSVTDQPNDRHITRSCASASKCDDSYLKTRNNPECLAVEQRILASNTQCDFCCTGDNCNKAPNLIPEATSLYSRP